MCGKDIEGCHDRVIPEEHVGAVAREEQGYRNRFGIFSQKTRPPHLYGVAVKAAALSSTKIVETRYFDEEKRRMSLKVLDLYISRHLRS
jgi:hypothetical protein